MKPVVRRSALKKMLFAMAGFAGIGMVSNTKGCSSQDKVVSDIDEYDDITLFPGFVRFGNLVFISGRGYHDPPYEIESHTDIVLKLVEKELVKAGSSMDKVLKATVYLDDIEDYRAMNGIYRGRFGENPPVRSTVAVAKGGVPGKSLIEIDVIAYV